MKNALLLTTLVLFWACAPQDKKSGDSNDHQEHAEHSAHAENVGKSKSPKKMAMTNIGENHVHIEYNSPSKRGREVFGGLVAYGEVWVTGAHKATTITFAKNVQIGGVNLDKGKYALFTIPGKEEWTIIINKNWDQHLADDYDAAQDIVRVKAKPVSLEETVESLTYDVTEIDESKGSVAISWDKVMVSFEVESI